MSVECTSDASPMINSRELAAMLDVSRMTISRWRRAGKLPRPAYGDGTITLWSRGDIEQWMIDGMGYAEPDLLAQAIHGKTPEEIGRMLAPMPPNEAEDDPTIAWLIGEADALLNCAAEFTKQIELDVRGVREVFCASNNE